MKQIYLISFLLLIAFRPIQAETLIELYQLAVQNDPKLKIAYQERIAIREKKHLASISPRSNLGC
jgi:outer membrane protein